MGKPYSRGVYIFQRATVLLCFGASLFLGAPSRGEIAAGASKWLEELPMEDLLNIEVISVAKKEVKLNESPAAVAVLTREDIRRLGATSIPEALRAVPGLEVARINANKWAISSRGFNDEYANKLLVMVDGRSVYTPTFGGVYWNAQDVLLEDLDRIEVIRGPGATLWGANAVNGVINIITRSAKETQGTLVSTTFGTEDQPSVSTRYGGQLASNLYYRVYAKYFDRAGFDDAGGHRMSDEWNMVRGGLRVDWEADERNAVTLLGDYYDGHFGEQAGKTSVYPAEYRILGIDAPTRGGNVLARWQRVLSEESDFKLQVNFDHYERKHPFGGGVLVAAADEFADGRNQMREQRDTVDLDWQHRFKLGSRNDIVWGAGYRHTEGSISSRGVEIFWSKERDASDLFSAFAQDEITVIRDRIRLTLGTKLERNDYTGFEVQPAARLLWTPTQRQTYWVSVARAVRTPTRLERDARINLGSFVLPDSTPGLVTTFSNPHGESEELMAYEAGCRFEPVRRLSFDVAAFFNDYKLSAAVPTGVGFEADPLPPHLVQSYYYVDGLRGHNYGVELLGRWQVTDRWRLTAGYTFLETSFDKEPTRVLMLSSPQNQFQVHSTVDLGRGWEFNTSLWYVDRIESLPQGIDLETISSYVRLDVGLGWKPTSWLELSVWGQNLLEAGHEEFASYKTSNVAEVPRTFFGRITMRF